MPHGDRTDLAPALQDGALPSDAPTLGGIRGYPPGIIEAVRWALIGAGMGPVAKRQGRAYQVVLAMLQAELGLLPAEVEALIGWHLKQDLA